MGAEESNSTRSTRLSRRIGLILSKQKKTAASGDRLFSSSLTFADLRPIDVLRHATLTVQTLPGLVLKLRFCEVSLTYRNLMQLSSSPAHWHYGFDWEIRRNWSFKVGSDPVGTLNQYSGTCPCSPTRHNTQEMTRGRRGIKGRGKIPDSGAAPGQPAERGNVQIQESKHEIPDLSESERMGVIRVNRESLARSQKFIVGAT